MKPIVYLAGPIAGCEYDEATNWRRTVEEALVDRCDVRNPMRDKAPVSGKIGFSSYTGDVLCSPSAIMTRDHADCTHAQVMLVNLLGATSASIGTVLEYGWAYDRRIPTVTVIEEDGSNPHDHHPMLIQCFGIRVCYLASAINVVESVLNLRGSHV